MNIQRGERKGGQKEITRKLISNLLSQTIRNQESIYKGWKSNKCYSAHT